MSSGGAAAVWGDSRLSMVLLATVGALLAALSLLASRSATGFGVALEQRALSQKAAGLADLFSPSIRPEEIQQVVARFRRSSEGKGEFRVLVTDPSGRALYSEEAEGASLSPAEGEAPRQAPEPTGAGDDDIAGEGGVMPRLSAAVTASRAIRLAGGPALVRVSRLVEGAAPPLPGPLFATLALAISVMAAVLILTLWGLASHRRSVGAIAREINNLLEGKPLPHAALRVAPPLDALSRVIRRTALLLTDRIDSLTRRLNQFETVLAGMAEGVMVTDGEGRLVLVNPSFGEIFNVTADPRGKTPIEVVRQPALQEALIRALRTGAEITRQLEFGPAGRTLDLHLVPLREGGAVVGAVGVFHDISELKRLEVVRKDFVANVSHELKTPLATIQGYAETLLRGALDDRGVGREFVEIIHRHTRRLALIVDELLMLSRLETKSSSVTFRPVQLQEVARSALRVVEPAAIDKGLHLEADCPDDLPQVRGDPHLLEQVVVNLLDNAVKYTDSGGRVTLRVLREGGHLRLDVQDTGQGIPEKHLPRLFERFYRVDAARSRSLGGTGLGLSIAKHILDLHNGRIWVKSRPGEGSTFHFSLPYVQEEGAAGEAAEGEESEAAGR